MATDTRELAVIFTAQDQASKTFNTIGKKAEALGRSMKNTGMAMIKIGAAPTAALVAATKAAIDFETAFAGVRKTVEATEAEFQQLSDNFREITKTTPVAATELSRIGELAGQLGVSGVDNLTKFTKTIADIAVTTNLTTESAATEFARLANVMQEPLDNVDRIGSAIVELGNNFATTEAEISMFAQNIAGAGKIAGLTTSEVLAIGAAMSSVGVEAAAGGTAVQKVLIAMQKSVVNGGEHLEAFAKTAGTTTDEFVDLFENDAASAFNSFVLGLGQEGDQAITTLDNLGLSNQRVIRAFLSLANAGDLLDTALATSATGWQENTALTAEAEKRYQTTASQIQIARNNLQDIGITIGGAVLPILNQMLQTLAPLVSKFAEWAEKNPELLTAFLAIGAAIGILGVVLVTLGVLIPAVVTAFTALGTIITFVSALVLGLNPILLIIIGAIALLKLAWETNFLGIQEIVQNFMTWLQDTVVPWFTTIFEGIGSAVSSFIDGWVSKWNTAKDAVLGVVSAIGEFISKAKEAASQAFGNFKLPGFEDGGFVPKTGVALLHKGEFVASQDMLQGRKSVPSSVSKVFNQPININANVGSGGEANLLGNRVAFALRNSRG